MALSKYMTHYDPRLGFPTPKSKGIPLSDNRGRNEQLCGFEPWEPPSVPKRICMWQQFLDIYWTLKLSLEQWNILFVCLMVFNATFDNISVISWRSVLLEEETGGPGENHLPAASQWQTLSHNVASSTHCLGGFELTTYQSIYKPGNFQMTFVFWKKLCYASL